MSEAPSVILTIESDLQTRQVLHILLDAHGYTVLECATGQAGIKLAELHQPSLILLDLAVPDMDGLKVIQQVREWSHVPILVLSTQPDIKSKVATLDAGADDYVTRPFSVVELLARIRVALRHAVQNGPSQGTPTFVTGALRLDFIRRQASISDQEVHLSPIEYRLLKLLAQNANMVVTHQQLLNDIWGSDHSSHVHYLHIYMRQLRHKLEADAGQPRYILTEPTVGYRLALLP